MKTQPKKVVSWKPGTTALIITSLLPPVQNSFLNTRLYLLIIVMIGGKQVSSYYTSESRIGSASAYD